MNEINYAQQNLVPNPSFEDTITIQFGIKHFKNWISPSEGSPDFLSPYNRDITGVPKNFAGYQEPRTGNAYCGVLMYSFHTANDSKRFREYIQNRISKPLLKDSIYCLQLFVSLADSFRYASINKLAVYFSKDEVNSSIFFYLPYSPQIVVSTEEFISEKEEWLEFNFEYRAEGGEEYVTIGNFTDSTNIDTLQVGGGDKNNPQWQGTYYYIDDVYLGHCDSVPEDSSNSIFEHGLVSNVKVYPNPTDEFLYLENNSNHPLEFELYNILGKQIPTKSNQIGNRFEFMVANLPKGIYLLNVISKKERAAIKIIKE